MAENTYKEMGGGRSIFYGWGEAMHTRFDAILCHRPQAECEAAFQKILSELKRLDGRLSKFDPSSDIARINALAADSPVPVDEEIWNILVSALRYGARTAFNFDVTYASKKGSPDNRIHLDPKKKAVLFKSRGTEIDLGGFGKGYGLQKIQETLLADGWTDFLLNFGNSSVCARGDRPGAEGWSIGVENQSRPGINALEVTLRNQSLNTSGNTAQHTRHIYSSKWNEYVPGSKSVSVVTGLPLEGEVLSTALFSAGHSTDPKDKTGLLKLFSNIHAYEIDYASGSPTVKVL